MTTPDDTVRLSIVKAGKSDVHDASMAEVKAAAANHRTRMRACIKLLQTPVPFPAVHIDDSDPPPAPDDVLTSEERRHVRR